MAHGTPPSLASRGEERPTDLLSKVVSGDADALRRFYEGCVDALYAFVFYRVGKDPSLAEDVVQQTFVVAFERHRTFDESRGSLSSWVCQLSRNVIRAHLKDRRRVEELDMWDKVDRALAEAFERMEREALVDEVIERRQTRDLVHVTMGHLAEPYRRLLERKYIEDRSLADMAVELEVSEEAVKSMLARARRAFRETFQTLGNTLAESES